MGEQLRRLTFVDPTLIDGPLPLLATERPSDQSLEPLPPLSSMVDGPVDERSEDSLAISVIRTEELLDAESMSRISEQVRSLLNRDIKWIILNLERTRQCDRFATLGLIRLWKEALEKSCQIILVVVTRDEQRKLLTVGVYNLFQVFPSMAEALESLRTVSGPPGSPDSAVE